MGATGYYLFRMINGDHRDGAFQQRMMRGRVGAQAFTILVMCASGMWAGHRANKEPVCQKEGIFWLKDGHFVTFFVLSLPIC